jgi:hypothetical protein
MLAKEQTQYIIDDHESEQFKVNRMVFKSEEIYRSEMEKDI